MRKAPRYWEHWDVQVSARNDTRGYEHTEYHQKHLVDLERVQRLLNCREEPSQKATVKTGIDDPGLHVHHTGLCAMKQCKAPMTRPIWHCCLHLN